jgi:hypothetical protein
MWYNKYIKYKSKYINLKNILKSQLVGGQRKKSVKRSIKQSKSIKPTVILMTTQLTPGIIDKLKDLLLHEINVYIMCDQEPILNDKSLEKYILYYPNKKMIELGWVYLYDSAPIITSWDKATYFAYTLNLPYVWLVEYDVYWNNTEKIIELFNIKNDADLICYPQSATYKESISWYHWKEAKINEIEKDKSKWIATFNQITRLSNRLLKKIDEIAKTKNRLYFHEIIFGTLCNINNYKITYITDLNLDLYINIKWKDAFTEQQVKQFINKYKKVLLHPVKYDVL